MEAIAARIDHTLAVQRDSGEQRGGTGEEMIVRRWHGRVPRSKSDEYMRLMRAVSIPDYRRVPGNIAAYVLRRDGGGIVEFETLSMWVSEAAIERYAGRQPLKAKYYEFDRNYLLEFEEFVTHYRSAFSLQS